MNETKGKTKMKTKTSKKIAVLITTDKDKRGVFGCYIDPKDAMNTSIEATDIQMCVLWSEAVKGVIGLAATGPDKDCRITKPAPRGVIHGVTAVLELSIEAEEAWKKAPWKS